MIYCMHYKAPLGFIDERNDVEGLMKIWIIEIDCIQYNIMFMYIFMNNILEFYIYTERERERERLVLEIWTYKNKYIRHHVCWLGGSPNEFVMTGECDQSLKGIHYTISGLMNYLKRALNITVSLWIKNIKTEGINCIIIYSYYSTIPIWFYIYVFYQMFC